MWVRAIQRRLWLRLRRKRFRCHERRLVHYCVLLLVGSKPGIGHDDARLRAHTNFGGL
jgi:hypothetical protein